jgi:shikimate kinase
MTNKYFLIGIPNCGKSTLGRRVADILKLPFFDTDTMAVERLNLENPIEIFRMAFSGRFLNAQLDVIIELAGLDSSAIIATGAETALRPECAERMRTAGAIIHIKRTPEILLENLRNSGKSGLVLYDKEHDIKIDMQEEAVKRYAQESSQYEALADLTFENNGSEDEGVEGLIKLINGDRGKHG